MAASGPRRGGPIADINVTPLVDVVLVLLIIFMVVTEVVAAEDRAIGIDLPSAATADKIDSKPLTVAVNAAGGYILDGQPADTEMVTTRVREELARRGPSMEVVVSADRAAAHEGFVGLLDMLRLQGVTRFAIQTALPEPGATGGG